MDLHAIDLGVARLNRALPERGAGAEREHDSGEHSHSAASLVVRAKRWTNASAVCATSPAAVDGERVAAVLHLDEFGDAGIRLLLLERGMRYRMRRRVVESRGRRRVHV